MPKSITATDIVVESLSVQADEGGMVTGLVANINVAFGDTRTREQFDLWAELTESQRTAFEDVHATLIQRLQQTYLA